MNRHTVVYYAADARGEIDAWLEITRKSRQQAEFHHHGDRAIPPDESFGEFSRELLREVGIPAQNRDGLHRSSRSCARSQRK
jgi:hypothetical protein